MMLELLDITPNNPADTVIKKFRRELNFLGKFRQYLNEVVNLNYKKNMILKNMPTRRLQDVADIFIA